VGLLSELLKLGEDENKEDCENGLGSLPDRFSCEFTPLPLLDLDLKYVVSVESKLILL
jgi:hypothetical protein